MKIRQMIVICDIPSTNPFETIIVNIKSMKIDKNMNQKIHMLFCLNLFHAFEQYIFSTQFNAI